MSVREAVVAAIEHLRADRGLEPAEVHDETALGAEGLGLDSLDMATIVAELEEQLEVDPFAHGVARFETVGDLVGLYERDVATA